jgi:hypothetical protein
MTPRPPSTGLAELDASSRIRARLLTGLATVHVRQQEIEQACRTAGEALRIATRTRTALSLQQVMTCAASSNAGRTAARFGSLTRSSGLPASVITAS